MNKITLGGCGLFLTCLMSSIHAYAMIPITSCSDLQIKIPQNLAGSYYLTQDLDCNDIKFQPIEGLFAGTLDGQGYTISNLQITNSDANKNNHTGLFRTLGPSIDGLYQPLITDIKFNNVQVTSHADYDRGFIAGNAVAAAIINVEINGLTLEEQGDRDFLGYSGGIIGKAQSTRLENVHVKNAFIKKSAFGGGLIGGVVNSDVRIDKSSVTHLSTANDHCATGDADSKCGFGGLVGVTFGVGETFISESSAHGNIGAHKNAGGLIGLIEPEHTVHIKNSYADVNLAPTGCASLGYKRCKYAGSLIGQAKQATGQQPVYLENVYGAGRVKLDAEDRGRAIVGHGDKNGSTRLTAISGTQSYFNINRVEKKNSGDKISVGLSETEMTNPNSSRFATWDRSIWKFQAGQLPTLYYKNTPTAY